MRVLITGASGFVGSHIAAAMAKSRDYDVYVVGRHSSVFSFPCTEAPSRITILRCEATRASIWQLVKTAQPDVVLHLAAEMIPPGGGTDVGSLVNSNVLFGALLLDCLAEFGVQAFVNTGTFWEHSGHPDIYLPLDLYAATKRAFADLLPYYSGVHGMRIITLELYSVYGPLDPRGKIMSLLEKSAEEDTTLAMSPGQQVMDLIYIDDVVVAYEKAIRFLLNQQEGICERVIIGNGVGYSLREVVFVFGQCIGKPLDILWGARPYRDREIMRHVADISRTTKLLGWEPKFSLEQGIKKMLQEDQR